jgi:hypothetical protein
MMSALPVSATSSTYTGEVALPCAQKFALAPATPDPASPATIYFCKAIRLR